MHQKIEIIPTLKAGFITHDSNSSNLDNSNVDDEKKIPTSKPKSEKSSEKMKSKDKPKGQKKSPTADPVSQGYPDEEYKLTQTKALGQRQQSPDFQVLDMNQIERSRKNRYQKVTQDL